MGLPPPAEGAEDKGGISEFDCMSEDEETAARTIMDEIQRQENQTKFAFVQQRECVKFDNQSPKMRRGGPRRWIRCAIELLLIKYCCCTNLTRRTAIGNVLQFDLWPWRRQAGGVLNAALHSRCA